MKLVIRSIKISLFFLLFAFSLSAKDIPVRPNTAVADYINLLSNSQRSSLEQRLRTFNDTSSTAIVLVIDDSTEGEDIFDYSYRMAEKWGIGAKGKDNGVLIYIAFKDKKIYIQTGSGLEGVLPDAILKRIIRNIVRPNFRKGNYYAGINGAVNTIMGLVSGEFTADGVGRNKNSNLVYVLSFIFLILFLLVIYLVYLCSKNDNCKNGGGGYHDGGRYNSGGDWIIGGGSGFSGSSSFGGGSGFGGSGFGGSGFGGFGGGGFSGGGAGGGW